MQEKRVNTDNKLNDTSKTKTGNREKEREEISQTFFSVLDPWYQKSH